MQRVFNRQLDRFPPFSEVFDGGLRSVFEDEVFHAWNNVDSGSRDFFGPSFWPVLSCHRVLVAELYEYWFLMK